MGWWHLPALIKDPLAKLVLCIVLICVSVWLYRKTPRSTPKEVED